MAPVLLAVLGSAVLAQAAGYNVVVGGACYGPARACTVGGSRVPYGTTWANFVAAEPVRKIAMSFDETCGKGIQQGPWHVQWWDISSSRAVSAGLNSDGSISGADKLADFGEVGPGVSSTRTFYLGEATNRRAGVVTYAGPNTQCAYFFMRGLSTNDLSLSGRVLGNCTDRGCKTRRPGLPGLTVQVRGTRSASVKTGGDGNYDFLLPRGHYTVETSAIATAPRSEHVDLRHDVRGVDLVAAAAGRVTLSPGLSFDVIGVIDHGGRRPEVTLLKLADATSNELATDAARGTVFPHVTLEVFRARTRRVVLTYALSRATIDSLTVASGDAATDTLKLEAASQTLHR